MNDGYYYRVTWESARGSVVHSDGGPYPSHRDLLAAIGRVKHQVLENSGRILETRGWKCPTPERELQQRAKYASDQKATEGPQA